MKIEFEKEYLKELYETGKTTSKKHRFQPQIVAGYLKCIRLLEIAETIEDLYVNNSLRYEKLKGDKKGLSSVRVNNQYRLEFIEITNANNIKEIEILSLTELSNHYQ
jgi:proteic killer suppression protein